jgi:hypothetical protein
MARLSEVESLRKWFAYNARIRECYFETLSKLSPEEVDDFFSHLTEDDLDQTYFVPKLPPWWDEDYTA